MDQQHDPCGFLEMLLRCLADEQKKDVDVLFPYLTTANCFQRVCSGCNDTKVKVQKDQIIRLPTFHINNRHYMHHTNIEDMIKHCFEDTEIPDFECSTCAAKLQSTTSSYIKTPPECAVFLATKENDLTVKQQDDVDGVAEWSGHNVYRDKLEFFGSEFVPCGFVVFQPPDDDADSSKSNLGHYITVTRVLDDENKLQPFVLFDDDIEKIQFSGKKWVI